MHARIGVQLYSVRDILQQGYESCVRRIAAMGFAGVETAGFAGTTPQAAAKLFKELGLHVPAAHTGMPTGPDKNKIIDEVSIIGSKRIISGFGPDQFKTVPDIRKSCDAFNLAAAAASEAGMTFGIHNHWWEFQPVEGKLVYEHMLDVLDPRVFFEIDCYWVKTAGADPASIVRRLGKRAPLLHIKDGPCEIGKPMTAVGEGKVDYKAVSAAAGSNAEWMIVEMDTCATDVMEALKKSYDYIVVNKLARKA